MKFYVLIAFVITCSYVSGDRVFDRIYTDIQSELTCIKRLNGTSEIGCSSSFWGNVGIIHIVKSMSNLTWLIENGNHPPYILAVIPDLFTAEFLTTASETGLISGVVLMTHPQYSIPSSFSGDQTCPNQQNSLYVNTSYQDYCDENPWNPYGTSLLFMNWDFPIFLLNDNKSVETLNSCYEEFNDPFLSKDPDNWPFCAVELNSNMYAAVNSEVCLRRSEVLITSGALCEPLEDINIWGSLFPLGNVTEEKSIMIFSTSADAASLFSGISPGADSAMTGLITFLLTAEALFRYAEDIKSNSELNILFTIFEGEAWNYIGSSRLVYDMVNDKFPNAINKELHNQMNPINLSHINSIIDLKQTGIITKGNKRSVFLHNDPLSNKEDDIFSLNQNIMNVLIDEGRKFNLDMMKASRTDKPIPPSSLQSFLKKKNISGVVVTDHESKYENKYYMSIFDDAENLNYQYNENGPIESDTVHKDIATLASIFASSLYKLLTGFDKKIEANATISNELMYCFLKNMNCTYFQENSDDHLKKFLKPAPAKTFVSVKRADSPLTVMTLRLLSRFMGQEVNHNETSCKSNNTQAYNLLYFPYVKDGICIQTTVHHSSALSPAFVIENYDWTSDEYSTWTESTWSISKARIFVIPSPHEEISLVVAGVISFGLSLITVHVLNSKARLLFTIQALPAAID